MRAEAAAGGGGGGGGEGAGGGRCTPRIPSWEEGSVMNGWRAIKVTLTKKAGSPIVILREGGVPQMTAPGPQMVKRRDPGGINDEAGISSRSCHCVSREFLRTYGTGG